MAPADDPDWSRVEHLLLRAETLLHASATSLERVNQKRRQEREWIASGLNDVRRPLAQIRLDMINLVEGMAAEAAQGGSMLWQGRLQEQLPPLENALINLERLLVQHAAPTDPGAGEGIRSRLEHLEFEQLLEQRHKQVIKLRAEVQRLEEIVRAAGLSPDGTQESGSI